MENFPLISWLYRWQHLYFLLLWIAHNDFRVTMTQWIYYQNNAPEVDDPNRTGDKSCNFLKKSKFEYVHIFEYFHCPYLEKSFKGGHQVKMRKNPRCRQIKISAQLILLIGNWVTTVAEVNPVMATGKRRNSYFLPIVDVMFYRFNQLSPTYVVSVDNWAPCNVMYSPSDCIVAGATFKRRVWKPEKRTLVSTICYTSYFLWNLSVEDTFSIWSLEFAYPGPFQAGRLDMKHVVIGAASEWTKVNAKIKILLDVHHQSVNAVDLDDCIGINWIHLFQPCIFHFWLLRNRKELWIPFGCSVLERGKPFNTAGRVFLNWLWQKMLQEAVNSVQVIRLFPLVNQSNINVLYVE